MTTGSRKRQIRGLPTQGKGGVLTSSGTHASRRARAHTLTLLAVTTALLFALSSTAVAKSGSLTITLKPPNPSANSQYKITLSGTAPSGGKFGKKHNRSELDIVEQIGGKCAATPQKEFKKNPQDLGPLFVKAGAFSFHQFRSATSSSGTTIVFCGYLSTKAHHLVAKATASYTT